MLRLAGTKSACRGVGQIPRARRLGGGYEGDSAGVIERDLRRNSHGESRLANTGNANERHDRGTFGQERRDIDDVGVAPNESRLHRPPRTSRPALARSVGEHVARNADEAKCRGKHVDRVLAWPRDLAALEVANGTFGECGALTEFAL